MTTPTAPETKERIAPDEMLACLREEAAHHRVQQRYYTRRAEYEAKSADTPGFEPEESAAQKRDQAERQRSNAGACGRRADILEKSIAILSVLEHPDFQQLTREETGEGYTFGVKTRATGWRSIRWADTPIAALLKAYEALKPQEGAGGSKGGPANA